jgi:signal transduction histidine kinase
MTAMPDLVGSLSDDRWGPDSTAAVVAHGLLNSMTVISGAAATLKEEWSGLAPESREMLLGMIQSQARHVTAMLADLARGLPPEMVHALDAIRASQGRGG